MRNRGKSTRLTRRSALAAALLVALAPVGLAGCSGASGHEWHSDPLTTDEVPHMSRQEIQRGIEDKSLTVVDTLPPDMHAKAHLPTAINIPGYPYDTAAATTDELAPKLLPDKNAKIVLYCINPPCRNSEYVGRRLIELGYTHVTKYSEGIQEWMQAGLPLESGAS